MRIAVVADIHGNAAALEAVCADIARWGPQCRFSIVSSLRSRQ
jgi:hypothetical protein